MSVERILGEDWYVCTSCAKPFAPQRGWRMPEGMREDFNGMYHCEDIIACRKRCDTKREIDRTRRFQP